MRCALTALTPPWGMGCSSHARVASACGRTWRVKHAVREVAVGSAVVTLQCERGGESRSAARQCEPAPHAACVFNTRNTRRA